MPWLFLRKINLLDIATKHVRTLEDARDPGKISATDLLIFYGIPAAITGTLMWRHVMLSDVAISVLTTALSILAGLLINLLVLLHTLNWDKHEVPKRDKVNELQRQLHANIAYAILVSLVALVPLTIAGNYDPHQYPLLRRGYGHASVYLSVHFALTMGMVLRRMYAMLEYRLPS